MGFYPVKDMFLAGAMLSAGLEMKPPGVSVVYTKDKPKSAGGDVTAYFKSHTKDGFCAATKIQKAWEDAELGDANPEGFEIFNELARQVGELEGVPRHVRARLANSLKEIAPRMCVEAIKLFLAHYREVKAAVKDAKPYAKVSLGGQTFEMRPVEDAAKC